LPLVESFFQVWRVCHPGCFTKLCVIPDLRVSANSVSG
jgi:hypothetical protein